MPSSSARCSQLPRAIDKVPFYTALKKLRDYIRGDTKHLDDSEVCFPDLELKVKVKNEGKDDEQERAQRHPDFNGLALKQDFKQEFECPPSMMHMPPPNFWAPPPQYQMNTMCGPMPGQFRTFDSPFAKAEPGASMGAMCSLMNAPASSSFAPSAHLQYPFSGMLTHNDFHQEFRLAAPEPQCSAASGMPSPAAPPQLTTLTTYHPPDAAQAAPRSCMNGAKAEPAESSASGVGKDSALGYMNVPDASFRPGSNCVPPFTTSSSATTYGGCTNTSPSSMYRGASNSPLASASSMCSNPPFITRPESMSRTQSPCYMTNPASGSNLINSAMSIPPPGYPQYPAYP